MSQHPGPNHLQGQTSPYLLQHLHNPVDWYPWGTEALTRSREEDRPIFLSIGYSACHWCHVMERESFEDPTVADYLNRHFVSIKVDREERPDVDEIYMNAVQLLTGQGGWPLSAFLTPELKPFFAGTYFPRESSHGLPGFLELLEHLRSVWDERRGDIDRSADEITERLRSIAAADSDRTGETTIGDPQQKQAVAELTRRFEPRWGGFGGAPKFPSDGAIRMLLLEHGRSGEAVPLDMVRRTLDGMALGGMYDQIGGGFARYSVDEKWLVPHFEKMLYNQALLVPLYLDTWKITGTPLYRRIVEETLDFVRRELVDDDGGFHSSLDADSEGKEGTFYVWTPEQIVDVLGYDQGRLACEVYGIDARGNFEGRSIPNLLHGSLGEQGRNRGLAEDQFVDQLADSRRKLRAARERRTRPATDDKVLTAWNGLAISAFALAYRGLRRPTDLETARAAADFALRRLVRGDRLHVSYRSGAARLNGYLDDYAFLGRGLIDLYEACFDERYLRMASTLARTVLTHFEDKERGGFFFVSDDHETLLTRNRSLHDGALPAGAGVALELLLRLGFHLGDETLREAARRGLAACRPFVDRSPSAFAATLGAADLARGPVAEVAIVGRADDPDTVVLLEAVGRRFLPRIALTWSPGETAGPAASVLAAGKSAVGGRATAYVCRNYSCRAPVHDSDELVRQLDELT